MQYVGQTRREFRIGMMEHRRAVINIVYKIKNMAMVFFNPKNVFYFFRKKFFSETPTNRTGNDSRRYKNVLVTLSIQKCIENDQKNFATQKSDSVTVRSGPGKK